MHCRIHRLVTMGPAVKVHSLLRGAEVAVAYKLELS